MEGSSQKPHHVFSCANSVQTDTVCRDFRMIYAIVISALLSSTAAIELSDAWKRMELCYIVGPICTSSDVEMWCCMVVHGCHTPWIPLCIWESFWWRLFNEIPSHTKPIIRLGAKGGRSCESVVKGPALETMVLRI